jgi:hypothetical protein
VRLPAEEMSALRDAMRQLQLPTTSDALREGIRLLVRQANEMAASERIRDFYEGGQAPLPAGVVAVTDAELAAVEAQEW